MWGGTEGAGGGRGLGRSNGFRVVSPIKWRTLSFPDTLGTCAGLECEAAHSRVYGCDCRSVSRGLIGSWAHGVRLSVSVCCHYHDTTRVNTKGKMKRPYCPKKWTLLWLKIKKVLQNYISLNRFFLSSHVYTKSFYTFTHKKRKGNSHYWKLFS